MEQPNPPNPIEEQPNPPNPIEEQPKDSQTAETEEEKKRKSTEPPPKKQKVRKNINSSWVWDHFTHVEGTSGSNRRSACNWCSHTYASHTKTSGTSNLSHHLKVLCKKFPKHLAPDWDVGQTILSLTKAEDSSSNDGIVSSVTDKYNEKAAREALAKYIAMDELPFRHSEGEGFRMFVSVICPRMQIPSRWTVARDCMQVYSLERAKLKKFLTSNRQRVSLTTDCWTSLQNLSYICVTTHFIDPNWKLHKRIICFCQIADHKGDTIGKTIERCLLEWGIDRVFCVTVDNASANDVAVNYVASKVNNWNGAVLDGSMMHVRCTAHILNLIVQEGLKDMDVSLLRIRQAVRYTRSSPSRLLKFRQCVEDEKLSTKSLPLLDTVTRWNSTYSMLESAVKCEKAFARLEDQETSYLRDFVSNATLQNPPTSKDWDVARRYVKFLQVFYEVTMKISGSTYVTSHTYFHDYCRILNLLKTWMEQSEDFGLSHLAERMKAKHDKYWGDLSCINHIHFVGVMLDPRYKTKFISWSFAKLFGKELADMVVGNVKRTLVSLYDHYRLHDSSSGRTDSASSSNASNVDMMCDDGSTFASEFMKEMSAEESLAGKSELDRYLFESHEAMSVNFDILNWWKVNAGKYPILSQLAMDVLAVPITTVPSEAAFSNGGRILDAYRSSLLPKTVEALICTENWLRSTPVTRMVEDSIEELEKIEEAMGKLDIGGELKS